MRGREKLFDARLVFSRRHAHVFFKDVIEMGEGIETQFSRDLRKRIFLSDEFFRFVDFEFQIGLIDAHARLFPKECAKVGLSVMEGGAKIVQLETVVEF